jgi:hypothetical protein
MSGLFTLAIIALVGWLVVRSMNREKARRDRSQAIKARLLQAHGIEDVFISREDDSFLGLSGDSALILLGQGDEGRTFPVAAIRAVEGLRDGTVMIRAEPDGDPITPAAEQDVSDLPERIVSLGLRVTLEDETHTVLFFQGGRHGVDPVNEQFRKQAARTEEWFRKLSTAMRLHR